jgi:putative spermidine/putrescine transport system substrate-binding protein
MRVRVRLWHIAFAALVAALAVPASAVSKAGAGVPTSIGKGEGQLKMIAWEGYLDPKWVKPFEQQSGCKVFAKYAGTSDDMVRLMKTGQYDMVSASGDASLRLIYSGDVAEVNVNLIPQWKQFFKGFQGPPNNTANGKHYGISLQFGPNTLMYNTKAFPKAPTSWAVIYDPKNKGKITIPDNPIQIADAALYLSRIKPSLKIKDPYELTKPQFDVVVALLKQQHPLIKKLWATSGDEQSLFKTGDATLGASWPVTTQALEAAKVPVKEIIPTQGATGWLDTWMLSTKSKHVNCAYLWWRYISTPKVQALQGVTWGETPVNRLACPYMDKLSKGACQTFHANETEAYYKQLKYWKTPLADCGNGQKSCMDYTKWVDAWNRIKS